MCIFCNTSCQDSIIKYKYGIYAIFLMLAYACLHKNPALSFSSFMIVTVSA